MPKPHATHPPTAVMYARVSSKEQEKEGFSIPAQLKVLRGYAEEHGFIVVQKYVDVETAKRAGRTGFTPSLRSQGTRRPAQDGKTRKIKGSFAYSATKHRYTNIEKSLDRAL